MYSRSQTQVCGSLEEFKSQRAIPIQSFLRTRLNHWVILLGDIGNGWISGRRKSGWKYLREKSLLLLRRSRFFRVLLPPSRCDYMDHTLQLVEQENDTDCRDNPKTMLRRGNSMWYWKAGPRSALWGSKGRRTVLVDWEHFQIRNTASAGDIETWIICFVISARLVLKWCFWWSLIRLPGTSDEDS